MNAALIVASTLGNAVERIGAYGGLASMIGLGVLALLYFAQAREVKRLREWAGRAPERAAEIEQRVQADAQRRVIAQPQTPAAAAPAANAPTGVRAPTAGLTGEAATRAAAAAIVAARATHPPAGGPPGQLARPAVPPAGTPGSPAPPPNPATGAVPKAPGVPPPPVGVPPTPAGPVAPAGAVPPAPGAPAAPGAVPPAGPGAAPAAQPAQPGQPPPAPTPPPAAAMATNPATATAPASGAAKPRVVAQPPAAGNGNAGQETRESAAARPEPPPALGPSGDVPPPDDGERSSVARIAAIVGGALACVLVAGAIVMLMGGDEPAPDKPNELGTAPPAEVVPGSSASTAQTAGVDRGATKTTVLNGTTTAGLARNVATKLEGAGFKIAEVGDNVDQTLPETVIYYSDGNRRAAAVIARIIGVSQSTIEPVDRNADVAGSGARVVVTVGADLIE